MLKRMISILLALVICVTSFSGVQLNAMATGETDVSALAEPTDPPEYVPALPTEAQPETEPVEMPEEWIPPATAPALPTEQATEPTEAPAPTETPGTGEDPSEIVDSVEWTLPNKTKYIVNQEELDTTGCTVLFTYQDGHQEQYDITPDMVRGFDNTVLGHQKLVVTCKDHKFSFSVTIIEEPKPAHFNFNSWAVKTGYLLGEELDLTGGELRVFYDNNSIEIVPVTDSNVTVSGYNPEIPGQQAITISYMGLTREFYVTVSAPTGKCGDNLYFEFDEDSGTLSITGTGAMYDYEWDMPWRGYSGRILKVELSDGLTTLGKGAFTCCGNLKGIDLPDTLTTISDHALEECYSLTDLTIPGSVKYIGVYALSGTRLTELVLPEGLETIDMYAFMSCYTLKNVVLPESLKHLGGGAFQYCTGLEEAQLPETLETVPWHTFIDCTSLKEIVIPKTVTEISYYAFAGCTSLEDVTFEGSAPYVDSGLFGEGYPFNYVTANAWYPGEDTTWTDGAKASLGGSLTWRPIGSEVPSEPVYPCSATVKIKASVRSEPSTYATKVASLEVGTQVCVYETTVTNNMEWARIDSGWVPLEYLDLSGNSGTGSVTGGSCGENLTWSFDDATGILTIAGSGAMYDYGWDGAPWKTYAEEILKVELPDTMTALGAHAFDGCINLTELKLPEGISVIPKYALNRCESLTDLKIPDSVKVIGDTAISDCNRLTSLVLPEGLKTVEDFAFCWNAELKEVKLPESLKSLGSNAFSNCPALETVNIPESIRTIEWGTFDGCTSLKEITIPRSVTEIAYWSFTGCTGLKTVTFEGSAPATSDWSPPFAGSTADAWYPGEDTTWTEEARMRLGAELNWKPYGTVENRLILDSAVFNGLESVCIDGMEYDIQKDGSFWYIDLPDGNARVMTAYEYHVDDPSDAQTRYPISMKVWTLKNDGGIYTATRQEAFDNIFQYSGVSIRVTGKKGIRMITSVEDGKKTALTGAGLAGYTLKEYGTAVAWSSHLRDDKPLVLGKAWTKSSYAYKQGVADLVFRQMDGFFLYTNVLVNFSNEQCRNLIAMRPYMILQDPEGEEITLYGGVVERSIGYIALMNRTAFMPDTDAYEFIWDIIHYVYGDSYDQDYIPSWTKPVM